jgi:chemotaxis signal transduction protein
MELTLLFKLGAETYGLEIDSIQEIVEDPDQHFVPRAKGVLSGAINFHGQIFAVINLPALLGFEDEYLDHRCVVLTPEYRSLALQISDIERIVKLDLSNLQPPPTETDSCAIRGVADFEGAMVNMLDTEDVLKQLEQIYEG